MPNVEEKGVQDAGVPATRTGFTAPAAIEVPPAGGREVKVQRAVALPGSLILFRDKTYQVSPTMTVTLPADATEEEIKKGGFGA